MCYLTKVFFILIQGYVFIGFRERGRRGERKRNIDMREKHQSVAFCTFPDQESNPQPVMTHDLSIWPPVLPLRGTEDGGGTPVLSGLHPNVTQVTQRTSARTSYLTPRKPRKCTGLPEYLVSAFCHSYVSFQQACTLWLVTIPVMKVKKHVSNDQGINFVCHCQR